MAQTKSNAQLGEKTKRSDEEEKDDTCEGKEEKAENAENVEIVVREGRKRKRGKN